MASGRGLRIALVTAALAVLTGGGLLWMGRRGAGGLAADFAVTDLQGQAVRLSQYRGQVVLLNLWATWCPPCREEMPSMERLWQRLKDRGFVLLAVSEDEQGAAAVRPFVQEMQLTFPVLLDPTGDVGSRYGVWGYPESFLIDREGRVVERVIGPRDWASPAQIAAIERLLAAPAGGGHVATPAVGGPGTPETGPPR
jgi:peroxiredoxin